MPTPDAVDKSRRPEADAIATRGTQLFRSNRKYEPHLIPQCLDPHHRRQARADLVESWRLTGQPPSCPHVHPNAAFHNVDGVGSRYWLDPETVLGGRVGGWEICRNCCPGSLGPGQFRHLPDRTREHSSSGQPRTPKRLLPSDLLSPFATIGSQPPTQPSSRQSQLPIDPSPAHASSAFCSMRPGHMTPARTRSGGSCPRT